jgi:hypothetical protein
MAAILFDGGMIGKVPNDGVAGGGIHGQLGQLLRDRVGDVCRRAYSLSPYALRLTAPLT